MLTTKRNLIDRGNHYNTLVDQYKGLDASGKSDLVKIENQGGLR